MFGNVSDEQRCRGTNEMLFALDDVRCPDKKRYSSENEMDYK